MAITILASLFMLIIFAIALFGFKAIIRQGKAPADINSEQCSLCRRQYDKSQMIERQVGDYRLFYFCASCITGLHNDLTKKE